MFIKSDLKFKVPVRSSDAWCINYLFFQLKYHGNDVLVGLVYKPLRIDGFSVYFPNLEELYIRNTSTAFFSAIEHKSAYEHRKIDAT
jgi:hypothetical protein